MNNNNNYKVLAIDPGNKYSAYVYCEVVNISNRQYKILEKGKVINEELFTIIDSLDIAREPYDLVIEMVASYGMAVGKEIFETVFWIGRFYEKSQSENRTLIYRKDVKMYLCNSMKAKDSNISQALRDRFGGKGTKKEQGFFYGFAKDEWSAFAIFITYVETGVLPF